MHPLRLGPLCLAIGWLLPSDAPPGPRPRPTARAGIPETELSYGELAQRRLRPAVDRLSDALTRLDVEVLPHEAKDLRRIIASARDLVDVFWFTLAVGGADGAFWAEVRDELDEGYELVGAFKDLFDAQGLTIADDDTAGDGVLGGEVSEEDIPYRHPEGLQRRRRRALRWAARFRAQSLPELARRVRESPAFAAPPAESPPPRSRFYWTAAQLRPSQDLTGHENLRRLLAGLARASAADAAAVAALSDPAAASDQERFHDFRKQLRGIVRLADLFPHLVSPVGSAGAGVEPLRRLVRDYGAIEDLVVAHAAAAKRDERHRANRLRTQIDGRWRRLRAQQAELRVAAVLEGLAASLCGPGPEPPPITGRAPVAPRPPRDPCLVRGAAPRP
jgi:hypothetical protein